MKPNLIYGHIQKQAYIEQLIASLCIICHVYVDMANKADSDSLVAEEATKRGCFACISDPAAQRLIQSTHFQNDQRRLMSYADNHLFFSYSV